MKWHKIDVEKLEKYAADVFNSDFKEKRVFKEIVGIPFSYMELSDGTNFVRFNYRVFAATGFHSYEAAAKLLDKILQDLYKAFPIAAQQDNVCVVIWRSEPQIERYGGEIGIYGRLATSPPVDESFWKKYEKREGERMPDYKEQK